MKLIYTLLILTIGLNLTAQDQTLVPFESIWKYLDNGSNQGTAWRANAFDDSAWAEGRGILGYGEGNENTIVSFGADPDDKHITTYFRHHFTIDDVSVFKNFLVKLKKDDAAIVYVNGQDVMRSNFGKKQLRLSRRGLLDRFGRRRRYYLGRINFPICFSKLEKMSSPLKFISVVEKALI